MPRELPSGTVTFLFTDVEGSTRLLHQLGPEGYAAALAAHRRVIRDAAARHGGIEVDNQGDAFFFAFPTAQGAVAAADTFSTGLAKGPILVRTGIHTGSPHLADEGYVGGDVHRAARIAAAGHGGQVLVSATTAGLSGSDDLHDLGEHRLKDLTAPERIFQLGAGEFPPLKTLHQTNLPVPATPFLGRETEIRQLGELLRRVDVRIVTLTGPGGTGKTRLAIQSAGASADAFPGGVWWVPLAPVRDPDVVIATAAAALGARGDLAEHIGKSQMLLVLDNFEQVIAAAPAVGRLLAACPNLRALVTSREPLHINGEWEYAVDPLTDAEARALFEARARAVGRDLQSDRSVAAICRRLDNLPLAIELAAARVKLLSPDALLARLEQRLPVLTAGGRDAPDRHRTLRATIAWSHDLLSFEEQRLFATMAVFRGGWTLDAAEAVADADLDTLQSLLDKSLVRQRNDRFWMLETIREFATEQLVLSGAADAVADRHAAHYLALAEQAEPVLAAGAPEWLDRLELDRDNLRAALDHLAASARTQEVLRLCAALLTFWAMRGYFAEGRRRIERALVADAAPTPARGYALLGAAQLADQTGDPDASRHHLDEALELFEGLGEPRGIARARYGLANLVAGSGDWATARDLFERSVADFEAVGDQFHRLAASRGLAWMHEELGEYERYLEIVRDNLRLARELGNRRIEARSLGALAMAALEAGRVDEARLLMTQSFAIDRELGFQTFIAIDLHRFAAILVRAGAAAEAAALIGRGDALIGEIGTTLESWMREERAATVEAIRAQLDEAQLEEALARGQAMSIDDAAAVAVRHPTVGSGLGP